MNNVINVARSSMPAFEEYCAEIRPLWDSRFLTNMGEKHLKLEADLKAYLGLDNLTLFTNGHLALENLLAALNLHGEIITTPFTFASTTHAIVRCGCTPVFCDIEPDFYTLDPAKVEALITPRTVAILPVHVYGNLCDVDALAALAKKHGLKLIYDAAHTFGVFRNGVSSGTFGDAAMFSFHATKAFHTIEGGAATYADPALSQRLNDLKNFGIHGPESVPDVGGNAKMNEFAAAMGICNLRHLDEEIEKRRKVYTRYRERLDGIPGLRLCPAQSGVRSNYAYFPVVFEDFRITRDEAFDRLSRENIIPRKYFYPLTSAFACYCGRPGFDPSATPVAARIAEQVLCLPMYADLAQDDVDRICSILLA